MLIRVLPFSVIAVCAAAAAHATELALEMTAPATASVPKWHFRTGVPFAKGTVTDKNTVRLFRGDKEIPVQTERLATWGPPGSALAESIKWLGLDFQDGIKAGGKQSYRLVVGEGAATQSGPALVKEVNGMLVIDSGRLRMTLGGAGKFDLFESVLLDGKPVVPEGDLPRGAFIKDGQGRTYWARLDPAAELKIEQNGPVAAVIRAEGWFVNPEAKDRVGVPGEPRQRPVGGFCRYVTRLYIGKGLPHVRVQHTFILTEDSRDTKFGNIGIRLPLGKEPGRETRIGGVDEALRGPGYLLQKESDKFVVKTTGPRAVPLPDGKKAAGWIASGKTAVLVKEFWQNFPKELECAAASPGESALLVHFWPAHGENNPGRQYTLANGLQLWFAHEGRLLDFNVPEGYFAPKFAGKFDQKIGKLITAFGIAKTHELIVSFDADKPDELNTAFQTDPHVLADPTHLCSAQPFGAPMVAAKDSKWPNVDENMFQGLRFADRMLDAVKNYGMFIYGDMHHNNDTAATLRTSEEELGFPVGPGYFRSWAGSHHGYPRLGWWFYVRSGAPDFLRFARAQTAQLMDVHITHWTNDKVKVTVPGTYRRKLVGGMCLYDNEGTVPWSSTSQRLYNAMIDVMLNDFYLTGNRRAWDVAMEHGYFTASYRLPDGNYVLQDGGRDAAAGLSTCTDLWRATWDPKVEKEMHRVADAMLALPAGKQHARNWTPWLQLYLEETGRQKAKDFLLQWADQGPREGEGEANIPAMAYHLTGDAKYARECARMFLNWGDKLFRDPNSPMEGYRFSYYRWGFDAQHATFAHQAASAVPLSLDLFRDSSPGDMVKVATPELGDRKSNPSFKWVKSPKGQQVLLLRFFVYLTEKDLPLKRTVGARNHARGVKFEVTEPGGKRVQSGEITYQEETRGYFSVNIEKGHPEGWYAIDAYNGGPFQMDLTGFHPTLLLYMGEGATFAQQSGHKFIYVPPDTSEISFSLAHGDKLSRPTFTVYDPEITQVAHVPVKFGENPVVSVPVPAKHRGKVWLIGGSNNAAVTDVKGIMPFAAADLATMERCIKGELPWPSLRNLKSP